MLGTVTAFSDERGDGTLLGDDGVEYYFHCVEIADGSRTVSVGTRLTAERIVGHLGRDEAGNLQAPERSTPAMLT